MNYMYNGHADVTALLGTDGAVKCTYYYDAFGKIVEQTGDVNNNITYAGYQLSLNLYTYCHNEPVMYADPSGYTDVYLNDLVSATSYKGNYTGKITWDSKTKTASVYVNGMNKNIKVESFS